jgi:hypothetical protein
MTITVLKESEDGLINIIKNSDFIIADDMLLEVTLQPGRYIILPRTMGYCMRKNVNLSFQSNFNPFISEGNLDMGTLQHIIEDIFYSHDFECKGALSFKEFNEIMYRFNKNYEYEEFIKLINKYSKGANGLTLNGLTLALKDILLSINSYQIMEGLRNLGYDRHLYPYLFKLYSIHFYSDKDIIVKPKYNIFSNYDNFVNKILLEEVAKNEKFKREELNNISYKSK